MEGIPVFPAIASQILAMLQNSETPIRDIVRVAEHDPGLTSNVLRLANSSYFAPVRSIGSLQDAVVRLGTRRLSELVLVSVTAPLAGQPIAAYDLAAGQLLEHSIAVGVGVETLAVEAGETIPPRNGFTAGLLHDLGKTVLGTCVGVDVTRILALANETGCSFEDAESRVLGINHAEVGALLLEHWNLPLDLVEAVHFHHAPDDAPRHLPLIDWVHMADQLAIETGLGAGIDGLQYRPSPTVVARMKLDSTIMERVVCKMVEGLGAFKELIERASGDSEHGA
jgi:putative nucleotidyltransferase with HDIG domain